METFTVTLHSALLSVFVFETLIMYVVVSRGVTTLEPLNGAVLNTPSISAEVAPFDVQLRTTDSPWKMNLGLTLILQDSEVGPVGVLQAEISQKRRAANKRKNKILIRTMSSFGQGKG